MLCVTGLSIWLWGIGLLCAKAMLLRVCLWGVLWSIGLLLLCISLRLDVDVRWLRVTLSWHLTCHRLRHALSLHCLPILLCLRLLRLQLRLTITAHLSWCLHHRLLQRLDMGVLTGGCARQS